MSIYAKRHIVATMYRGRSKEVIMVRRYSYFDTAMPRMLQMAISVCNEGDFVEFASDDYAFHLGDLRIEKGGRFQVVMNPLVKDCPALLKLVSEKPDQVSALVASAMRR